MPTQRASVQVMWPDGLHARPAALLVRAAKTYANAIAIVYGSKRANAKSIIEVMALGVPSGASIDLEVDGDDAASVLQDLKDYLSRRSPFSP